MTLADLQRLHSRQHHRYVTSHYHVEDGEGPLVAADTLDADGEAIVAEYATRTRRWAREARRAGFGLSAVAA